MEKKWNKLFLFIWYKLLIFFILFNIYTPSIAQTTIQNGERLAKVFCASCHQFPEPALLDKQTWVNGVLPNMALRLGIRKPNTDPYKDMDADEINLVKPLNIYPEKPSISIADWNKIYAYYKSTAPETLQDSAQGKNWFKSKSFSITPLHLGDDKFPMVTMLKFDSSKNELYVGDAQKSLYILNDQLQLSGYWMLNGPPADIRFRKNRSPRVVTVGSIAPTEKKNGALFTIDSIPSNQADDQPKTRLARPVQLSSADLDADGILDEVVCEFGNHTGKLTAFLSGHGMNVLKQLPGSRKTILTDLDNNGKIDILVLMAQARESVSWFKNMGDGMFQEYPLLSFHPLFGASNIELADMNKDGFPDIILSNGDNWDLSPIRKLYHGVRVYLNDTHNHFTLAYYFPLYGASKAIPFDFDQDGDIDIAAVSFYDDPEDPATSFVLLVNQGNQTFIPTYIPELPVGKWLTMDIGDIDKDGDTDIFLGSYFHNGAEITKSVTSGNTEFPHVVILYNKTK